MNDQEEKQPERYKLSEAEIGLRLMEIVRRIEKAEQLGE
jgi:hypothetical protein